MAIPIGGNKIAKSRPKCSQFGDGETESSRHLSSEHLFSHEHHSPSPNPDTRNSTGMYYEVIIFC